MKISSLFLILLLPFCASAQLTGRVVDVHDGDTFTMLVDCQRRVTVRLSSIDCPELDQPYGYTARRRVVKLCFDKDITVDSIGRDRYGRVLGLCLLPNGDTLNYRLIKDGLAWQYVKYDKSPYLKELQNIAHRNRKGLWRKDATPPWEWR